MAETESRCTKAFIHLYHFLSAPELKPPSYYYMSLASDGAITELHKHT